MTIDRNHRMHDTRGRFAPKPYGTDDDLQDMSPTELCLQLAKRRNVDMIWRSANIEKWRSHSLQQSVYAL